MPLKNATDMSAAGESSSSSSLHNGEKKRLIAFATLWLGQFFSILATDVAKFALRVWTYQQTSSVTQYALVTFCTEVPALLFAPVAGVLIDRYHDQRQRRWAIVGADAVAAASSACLAWLVAAGDGRRLQPHHVYLANAVAAMANAIQAPAFTTMTAVLVPPHHRVRVSAAAEAVAGISMLLAPAIAGAVLAWGGLETVFVMEQSTFVLAAACTLLMRLPPQKAPQAPQPVATARTERAERATTTTTKNPKNKDNKSRHNTNTIVGAWAALVADNRAALGFISSHQGLLGLLILLALGQFSSGLVQVLMTPLILGFAPPSTLGHVLTVSGLGAIAGAVALAVTGVRDTRRAHLVLLMTLIQGVLLVCCGIRANAMLVLSVAFCYMSTVPVSRACRTALWQAKTPPGMHGRVFALQKGLARASLPLAAIVAGPLGDFVEPLLQQPQGALARSLVGGAMVGTGPGRGAALLFVVAGVVNAAAALAGMAWPPLRLVDTAVPDAEEKEEGGVEEVTEEGKDGKEDKKKI